jgi:Flp pilus assembly protein TadG
MRIKKIQEQEGQTLILFALMLSVLILFIALVVDVGMFMEQRRNAQNVVDASALAGAQELPDDPTEAAIQARDYATRNGFDPADLDITFQCTTTLTTVCNPALNKYDTIVVRASVTSPAYFGPILNITGGSGLCWTTGCSTTVSAAGCRGLCGAQGDLVDAVVALDHTGSMQNSELQNAKDGALQLMKIFNPQVHQIGLTVTPPVHTADNCDTVETWLDSDLTWMPDGLTNSYATSQGSLNMGSQLVQNTQCLDLAGGGDVPGPHTDLAEPFKAAMNELNANGRPGAKLGLIFLTDGAANVYGDPAAGVTAGALGPCDYASRMASQAKAAGIEVYTIGYGVNENCTRETAASPWNNVAVSTLLLSMATDSSHFFNQPASQDLDPVFAAIGVQLAAGSKLVE